MTDVPAPSTPATTSYSGKPPQCLWGILTRRERWGLSWLGRLIVVLALLLAAGFLVLGVHPFLAVTHRVDANVLVVEGWVHEFGIVAAANEFKTGSYQRIFTTGGPVLGSAGYTSDLDTFARVGERAMWECGIPAEVVQRVPSHEIGRDRTYSSAVALRDWFRENKIVVSGINVVTENTHARRTQLLYQEALGKKVKVGVIAATNPDYDAKHWWRYSDGVRDVCGEVIAYLYAKFFFHPSDQSNSP